MVHKPPYFKLIDLETCNQIVCNRTVCIWTVSNGPTEGLSRRKPYVTFQFVIFKIPSFAHVISFSFIPNIRKIDNKGGRGGGTLGWCLQCMRGEGRGYFGLVPAVYKGGGEGGFQATYTACVLFGSCNDSQYPWHKVLKRNK